MTYRFFVFFVEGEVFLPFFTPFLDDAFGEDDILAASRFILSASAPKILSILVFFELEEVELLPFFADL